MLCFLNLAGSSYMSVTTEVSKVEPRQFVNVLFRLSSFVKDCDNSELHAGSLKARKVRKTCVSDVTKLKIWQFVYKP